MKPYPDLTVGVPRTNRYPLTPEHETFVKDIAALINERQRIARKARERYISMGIYISPNRHLEMLNLPEDGFHPNTSISNLLNWITIVAPDRITVRDEFGGVVELSLTELHMPVREFAKETRRAAFTLAVQEAARNVTPWTKQCATSKEELHQMVTTLDAATRKETELTDSELVRLEEAVNTEEAIKEYEKRA